MKKLMIIALTLVAGISFAGEYAPSAVPKDTTMPDMMPGQVNFQGLLRDPVTGNVYSNGLYDLECRIYTSNGTTPLWGGKYQAYVRDGYFNIMLGSSATQLSGCTYKPTDLWKALWYNGANRDLYLGVTPWQHADGTTIVDAEDRVEISPRQQLLATPYAFRAQKAQYADGATGDFDVKGDLKVAGQILDGSGTAFALKNVSANDDVIAIGKDTVTPAKTTMQGSQVNIESGDALNITPGGNMRVTTAAGKDLGVTGGGEIWVNVTDDVSVRGDDITVAANDELKMSGANGARVTDEWGNGILVTGSKVQWVQGSGYKQTPILFESCTIEIAKGTTRVNKSLESLGLTYVGTNQSKAMEYNWCVVGHEVISGTQTTFSKILTWVNDSAGVKNWRMLTLERTDTAACTVKVHLMGILKEFSTDNRKY